jgi:hypothetical protein
MHHPLLLARSYLLHKLSKAAAHPPAHPSASPTRRRPHQKDAVECAKPLQAALPPPSPPVPLNSRLFTPNPPDPSRAPTPHPFSLAFVCAHGQRIDGATYVPMSLPPSSLPAAAAAAAAAEAAATLPSTFVFWGGCSFYVWSLQSPPVASAEATASSRCLRYITTHTFSSPISSCQFTPLQPARSPGTVSPQTFPSLKVTLAPPKPTGIPPPPCPTQPNAAAHPPSACDEQ